MDIEVYIVTPAPAALPLRPIVNHVNNNRHKIRFGNMSGHV